MAKENKKELEIQKETTEALKKEEFTIEEIKKMNIYEKLSNITFELPIVNKALSITMTRDRNYRAVSEADIMAAVTPLEHKYRIFSYPIAHDIVKDEIATVTKTFKDTKRNTENIQETSNVFLRIKSTYRFVNIDQKDEYIDVIAYGDGIDSQDKAPGKAVTYADKYAIMKGYKIQTGEDPDKYPSGDTIKIEEPLPQRKDEFIKKSNTLEAKPAPNEQTKESSSPATPSINNEDTDVEKIISQIKEKVDTLKLSGTERSIIVETIKSHFQDNGKPSANYKLIPDKETANSVLTALNELDKKEEKKEGQ